MTRWWIDEPVFLGSSNPTTDQLKQLHQESFKSIISLLDEREQCPNYDIEETKSMGFHRYSIPIQDYCAPTLDQIQEFLRTVRRTLADGKVLMHCEGGSGRTGTMAAAYWIEKGLPVEKAIAKIRQFKPGAIETDEQEDVLYQLENSLESHSSKMVRAVCFDFKGVLVNHKVYGEFIPGIKELLEVLRERGLRLAIVSTLSPEEVGAELGPLREYFGDIMSGSEEGKLRCIENFAEKHDIKDLSEIAFIDDSWRNLLPVSGGSEVRTIGFRGSGMFPQTPGFCEERGIPFAETVADLRRLLAVE